MISDSVVEISTVDLCNQLIRHYLAEDEAKSFKRRLYSKLLNHKKYNKKSKKENNLILNKFMIKLFLLLSPHLAHANQRIIQICDTLNKNKNIDKLNLFVYFLILLKRDKSDTKPNPLRHLFESEVNHQKIRPKSELSSFFRPTRDKLKIYPVQTPNSPAKTIDEPQSKTWDAVIWTDMLNHNKFPAKSHPSTTETDLPPAPNSSPLLENIHFICRQFNRLHLYLTMNHVTPNRPLRSSLLDSLLLAFSEFTAKILRHQQPQPLIRHIEDELDMTVADHHRRFVYIFAASLYGPLLRDLWRCVNSGRENWAVVRTEFAGSRDRNFWIHGFEGALEGLMRQFEAAVVECNKIVSFLDICGAFRREYKFYKSFQKMGFELAGFTRSDRERISKEAREYFCSLNRQFDDLCQKRLVEKFEQQEEIKRREIMRVRDAQVRQREILKNSVDVTKSQKRREYGEELRRQIEENIVRRAAQQEEQIGDSTEEMLVTEDIKREIIELYQHKMKKVDVRIDKADWAIKRRSLRDRRQAVINSLPDEADPSGAARADERARAMTPQQLQIDTRRDETSEQAQIDTLRVGSVGEERGCVEITVPEEIDANGVTFLGEQTTSLRDQVDANGVSHLRGQRSSPPHEIDVSGSEDQGGCATASPPNVTEASRPQPDGMFPWKEGSVIISPSVEGEIGKSENVRGNGGRETVECVTTVDGHHLTCTYSLRDNNDDIIKQLTFDSHVEYQQDNSEDKMEYFPHVEYQQDNSEDKIEYFPSTTDQMCHLMSNLIEHSPLPDGEQSYTETIDNWMTCVVIPQSLILNRMAHHYIFHLCSFADYFDSICAILLYGDTLFSSHFTAGLYRSVIDNIGSVSPNLMNRLLVDSLAAIGLDPPICDIRFIPPDDSITHTCPMFSKIFKLPRLLWRVTWPLNIVLTDGCLEKYSEMFKLLTRLELCYHHLLGLRIGRENRIVFITHHEMLNYIVLLKQYFYTQINVSRGEFDGGVPGVETVDGLHDLHFSFVAKTYSRCFLTAKPIVEALDEIFGIIFEFVSAVGCGGGGGGFLERFRNYIHVLLTVAHNVARRSYVPFLDELVIKLNFNYYYVIGDIL